MIHSAPRFARYIGIDYSGAKTAESSLPGLRVYEARGDAEPREVPPSPSPRRYWTRRGFAHWLAETLAYGSPTLVGIDHAFSFPIRYLDQHLIAHDWDAFLDDLQLHWPTEGRNTSVEDVRIGKVGHGAARGGEARWRRLCEQRTRAKSVFHFDVQGSVAKSSHAGIPWLRWLRRQPELNLHFWPFDGWQSPAGVSVLAEVYPALWKHAWPIADRTSDQHDAYCAAAWLQQADRDGQLSRHLAPDLDQQTRAIAGVEGWILGVAG
jgi:hypothetical protein